MQFRGLRDVNEFAARAARLKALKEVKAAIKGELTEENDQANLLEKLETLLAQLKDATSQPGRRWPSSRRGCSDLSEAGGRRPGRRRAARGPVACRRRRCACKWREEAPALRQRKGYAALPARNSNWRRWENQSQKDPRVFYELAAACASRRQQGRIGDHGARGRRSSARFSDLARMGNEQHADFILPGMKRRALKIIAGLEEELIPANSRQTVRIARARGHRPRRTVTFTR